MADTSAQCVSTILVIKIVKFRLHSITVATILTTHSLAVSQAMKIHRLINKFHRSKGKNQTHQKKSRQVDGDKELTSIIQERKGKSVEILGKNM
nr:unnamed protein product [Callosobruchus chinensis]